MPRYTWHKNKIKKHGIKKSWPSKWSLHKVWNLRDSCTVSNKNLLTLLTIENILFWVKSCTFSKANPSDWINSYLHPDELSSLLGAKWHWGCRVAGVSFSFLAALDQTWGGALGQGKEVSTGSLENWRKSLRTKIFFSRIVKEFNRCVTVVFS